MRKTYQIKNRFTNAVMFEYTVPDDQVGVHQSQLIGLAVRKALESDAYLGGADLRDADLRDAYLGGADLRDADLRDAYLGGAYIFKIKNIDAAILAAIEAPGNKLRMSSWHTCGTTHCRAGWAIHLAGDAGYKLEKVVGSAAAGALIYAASRPDKPVPDFLASDADALADLRACAAEAA
jgi:uncharacterized protein YjbI with pentapeptide repeats